MIVLFRNKVIKITRMAKIKMKIKNTKNIIKYIYGYISYNIKSVTGEKIFFTSFLTSSVCNMSKHCLSKEFGFFINILITIKLYIIFFENLLHNKTLIACFLYFIFLLFQ